MARLNSVTKAIPVPVLLMVRELGSGGIERDVTKLAIGLDRLRFTPYVASFNSHGLRYDDLRNAGVSVYTFPVTSLKSPKIFSAILQFRDLISNKKIRILHAFDASGIFGIPLAKLLGVPAVLSSTLGHRGLLDPRTRLQFKITDRLADAIVVNCIAMRKHLMEDFSVASGRIELCYNGVDTAEFYPSADPKPIRDPDHLIVIGSVCVLRPEKALEVLQEAFAQIQHVAPNARLLIVGDGPELQKLQTNSVRLGIQNVSVFRPAASRVAPLMRSIDIFVSCSYSEAFSNSILEAMACGCCVVASRVGGTPELIEDKQRGLLFPAGSVAELAEKLRLLIDDPQLRHLFGRNAAKFAASNLNMDRTVQCTSDIYDKLISREYC
jgi:glycosyltransferase involved in cell wall biosynthesis